MAKHHVFATAGTFNASATVSDGKSDAKTPDVPVTVRNIFTFTGTFDGGVGNLSVVANGSGFTGETLTFNRQ